MMECLRELVDQFIPQSLPADIENVYHEDAQTGKKEGVNQSEKVKSP